MLRTQRSRDGLLAASIAAIVGSVLWVMVTAEPRPEVIDGTREVVVSVAPTTYVTVTAQPTATPTVTVTATRTVTVSRDRARQAVGDGVWDRLAQCESGGRWDYNGSSGYDGGLQFSPRYWPFMADLAGVDADYAWQASREEQIRVAEVILKRQGWGAWPACSAKLGLR